MSQDQFATEIAVALNKAVTVRRIPVKTIAFWTGANERTVKNWLSGAYGPSGDHLMVLGRHCEEVLDAILTMVGRQEMRSDADLASVEARVVDLLKLIRELRNST